MGWSMLKGVRCVRGKAISMEEHLRCQMQEIGPPCQIPPTVLNMILAPDTEREKEGVVYSHSSIMGAIGERYYPKTTTTFSMWAPSTRRSGARYSTTVLAVNQHRQVRLEWFVS